MNVSFLLLCFHLFPCILSSQEKPIPSESVPWFALKVRAVNEEVPENFEAESMEGTIEEKDSKESKEEEIEKPRKNVNFVTVDLKSPKETKTYTIAELDTRGRVGPTFEVIDTIYVEPGTKYESDPHLVHALDTNHFEKEFIAIDTSNWDHTELRSRLRNLSILMEDRGENHRDLGSSFILPVLNSVNYDNNTVPVAFSDVPVHVAVQLKVLYLADFNSELMEFSMDVEMTMIWLDLRLANNYTKPVRIREKEILEQIWRPDPYFVNSKFSYFHHVSFPNFRMRITPDGLVSYTMRITSVCNCFMFFCLYPHDRQTCDVKISSIAYPSSFVRFHWHEDPIIFQSNMTLPELQIKTVSTETCSVEGKLIRSSCLRLVFELERDGARIVVEKYIPSTLAMMFAWVAPFVPYNYEEVRIVTPITVLLTLVQMEKGDGDIRTSYLTSLDIWFAAMKMFTVLSLLESLIVLALIKRSRAENKAADRATSELEELNYRNSAERLDKLYHRFDYASRILWPIVFVLFIAYYVLFVAQGEEGSCVRRREAMR